MFSCPALLSHHKKIHVHKKKHNGNEHNGWPAAKITIPSCLKEDKSAVYSHTLLKRGKTGNGPKSVRHVFSPIFWTHCDVRLQRLLICISQCKWDATFLSLIHRFEDLRCISPGSRAQIQSHKKEKKQFPLSPSPCGAVVWEDACHHCLFILGRKLLSPHVFSELTKAWQLPTVPFNRPRPRTATPEATRSSPSDIQSKVPLSTLLKVYILNIPDRIKPMLNSPVREEGEQKQFGMSDIGKVGWGGVGGGGCLESDPFSKSLLLFPSCLCFKTGKLLAFETYPFPICRAAAPVVITSPLPSAFVERR